MTTNITEFRPVPLLLIPSAAYGDYSDSSNDKFAERNFLVDFNELNSTIAHYNATTEPSKKLELLYSIAQQQDIIIRKLNPDLPTLAPNVHTQFNVELFNELKKHFSFYNIHSLLSVFSAKTDANIENANTRKPHRPFAEILANMEPRHLDKMLECCMCYKSDPNKLAVELKNIPHQPLIDFMSKNKISFLGGSNSINFKITSTINPQEQPYVLKIENRMGTTRVLELKLRSSEFAQHLTSVSAERIGVCQYPDRNGKMITCTRTLLITDFCTGDDLLTHGKVTKNAPISERIETIINLFSQMARIVQTLQENSLAFPDMKNTNWLLENGQLKIADTKSFIQLKHRKYLTRIASHTTISPEMMQIAPDGTRTATPFSNADRVHSYIIGKNLYGYITTCKTEDLMTALVNPSNRNSPVFVPKHQGDLFDFSNPLFATEQGAALKQLIKDTVKPIPEDRLPVTGILSELRRILAMPYQKQLNYILLPYKNVVLSSTRNYIENQWATFERLKKNDDVTGMANLIKETEQELKRTQSQPEMIYVPQKNNLEVHQTGAARNATTNRPQQRP